VVADKETRRAAIVDPEVEIVEPMLDFVFEYGLKPFYAVDTHTHADHISGARELNAKTVARVVMHEKAPSSAVDIRVEDGDRLWLGDELSLKFLHTPGHDQDLISILLPGRIITADALLMGSCGRNDLANGNATRQYHTLYYVLRSLPDALRVYPGHDYEGQSFSTLGEEKNNPKMNFPSEEAFVEFMERENSGSLTPVYQLAEALRANMA
jgi:glyoxylase-like metal-dependent hydrolase (beta-lactamase superfamily II)